MSVFYFILLNLLPFPSSRDGSCSSISPPFLLLFSSFSPPSPPQYYFDLIIAVAGVAVVCVITLPVIALPPLPLLNKFPEQGQEVKENEGRRRRNIYLLCQNIKPQLSKFCVTVTPVALTLFVEIYCYLTQC